MSNKFRKVVEAQVYLSENTWKHSVLGPASVFSIQTIPVEKDFQKTFNSQDTRFIPTHPISTMHLFCFTNISANPMLRRGFQQKREEELRHGCKTTVGVSNEFMDYYTAYPSGGIYDSITSLR